MGTPEDVAAEKYFTPPEPEQETREKIRTILYHNDKEEATNLILALFPESCKNCPLVKEHHA